MNKEEENTNEIGLILNAQQFVDRIHDLNYQMYCDVLDRLSESVPQATGEWYRDEEGNMIMLFEEQDVLDESWRKDTNELKARAKSEEVADFVEALAIWGFSYHHHSLLWEAMVSVVEAEERGDFDGELGDEQ